MLNYEIIATGSTGNSVLIEDYLFDIGVPFEKIRHILKNVKYIFITHVHTDHLKVDTYRLISKNFPKIKFFGNIEVEEKIKHLSLKNFTLIKKNQTINFKNGNILNVFEVPHDVLTFGFRFTKNSLKIIYTTDCGSLEHITAKNYDYGFIECNHDLGKLLSFANDRDTTYYERARFERVMKTHLNSVQYLEFGKINKIKNLISLHMSEKNL